MAGYATPFRLEKQKRRDSRTSPAVFIADAGKFLGFHFPGVAGAQQLAMSPAPRLAVTSLTWLSTVSS